MEAARELKKIQAHRGVPIGQSGLPVMKFSRSIEVLLSMGELI